MLESAACRDFGFSMDVSRLLAHELAAPAVVIVDYTDMTEADSAQTSVTTANRKMASARVRVMVPLSEDDCQLMLPIV